MTEGVAVAPHSAPRRAAERIPASCRSALLVAVAIALAGSPPAGADPAGYPGYTAVDPAPFQNYFTYGGAGVQFTSPSGLMCRIVVISRGEFADAECFGKLAGVGDSNYVWISTGGAAGYRNESLSQFLTHQTIDDHGVHSEPVSANDFHLLPPGHSITYTVQNLWSGTCAVDDDTTRCTISVNAPSYSTTKSFTLTPTETTTS